MPAFGFSVGDFVVAIELCTKIVKALKNSGGAASEYQEVVIELEGLQNVLIRLAALEPTGSNAQHVNAIRGAALASTLSLQDVLSKLEKFDSTMSPFGARKTISFKGAARRAQYALFTADEIKNIRAVIYGNVLRINVLLAVHASEALSQNEDAQASRQQEVMASFASVRNDMAQTIKEIAEMKADAVHNLTSKVEESTLTLTQRLSSLATSVGSAAKSIIDVREFSLQIVSLLRIIPAELGSLIQNVIRSNARIEASLLQLDKRISASPSLSLDTNIRLEDALGRVHDIPFEWFKDWEIFEGLLKARFRNLPGHQKIESGEFRLVPARNSSTSFTKDTWSFRISPGTQIIMLMLIKSIAFRDFSCPRQSCNGRISSKASTLDLLHCPECNLHFTTRANLTEDTEAAEIFRLQSLEDMKLFGKRPIVNQIEAPKDAVHVQDISEHSESPIPTDEGGTEVNSGLHLTALSLISDADKEPPIVLWLSQTEVPDDPHSAREVYDSANTERIEDKNREVQDLEIFRNVQVNAPAEVSAPEPFESIFASPEEPGQELVSFEIFLRNIRDKFPGIQIELAHSMAHQNCGRQKFLKRKQWSGARNLTSVATQGSQTQSEERKFSKGSKLRVNKATEPDFQTNSADFDREDTREFESPSNLSRGLHELQSKVESQSYSLYKCNRIKPKTAGHCNQKFSSLADLTIHDYEIHNIGNSTFRCPICSEYKSFSHNDGIRHMQQFHQEVFFDGDIFQVLAHPSFTHDCDQSKRIKKEKTRRLCYLPPLPLSRTKSNPQMLCYLCHSQVNLQNKQSWRYHLMNDLKPYSCFVSGCSSVEMGFSRRTDLLSHIRSHTAPIDADGTGMIDCPFCWAVKLPSPWQNDGRTSVKHLGRHMEEIAFGILTIGYEDWSYDESDSDHPTDEQDRRPDTPVRCDSSDKLSFEGQETSEEELKTSEAELPSHEQPSPLSFPLQHWLRSHDGPWEELSGQSLEILRGLELQPSQEEQNSSHEEQNSSHEEENSSQGNAEPETNFWTRKRTRRSSRSSVNSRLRDPYPAGKVRNYIG